MLLLGHILSISVTINEKLEHAFRRAVRFIFDAFWYLILIFDTCSKSFLNSFSSMLQMGEDPFLLKFLYIIQRAIKGPWLSLKFNCGKNSHIKFINRNRSQFLSTALWSFYYSKTSSTTLTIYIILITQSRTF